MKKIFALLILAILSTSCSDSSHTPSESSVLEQKLNSNSEWPFEVSGVLDIIEAGGYDESEYPAWAIGEFVQEGDDFGVLVHIKDNVAAAAKLNVDPAKAVTVWLGSPEKEHGILTYPVEKMDMK